LGDFANQELVRFTKVRVGTFAVAEASNRKLLQRSPKR
jgi:hypothetical protein